MAETQYKRRMSYLKASELKTLKSWHPDNMPAVTCANQGAWLDTQYVEVEHGGQMFRFGHWDSWNGPFFVVEMRTGIIFRGTLGDCKGWVRLCVEADHPERCRLYAESTR